MTRVKFATVFAMIVCATGSIPNSAKAQMGPANLGGYCYTCAQFYHPSLKRTSPTVDNSQSSPSYSSSIERIRAQQRKCAREVYDRYNEPDQNDPSYPDFLADLQNECVTRFLNR
jgi:hypothetical protein